MTGMQQNLSNSLEKSGSLAFVSIFDTNFHQPRVSTSELAWPETDMTKCKICIGRNVRGGVSVMTHDRENYNLFTSSQLVCFYTAHNLVHNHAFPLFSSLSRSLSLLRISTDRQASEIVEGCINLRSAAIILWCEGRD